jgi:hypothetical protein
MDNPLPQPAAFPDRLNTYLTTEHFTLQSARSILMSESNNRVSVYFTTLSSVLIASGFLAQIPAMSQMLLLLAWTAFPVTVVLGLFTFARLMELGRMDSVYIRAINRVRQFYVQAAPEAGQFLMFPPYDDQRSTQLYGGYSLGARGNLLSVGHVVVICNSIVITVLLSILISTWLNMTFARFAPFGLGLLALAYMSHTLFAVTVARRFRQPEYEDVRFPAPKPS